jgi:hypothetical protein
VQRAPSVRAWAAVGLAAQVVFVLSWLVAGLWQGQSYHARKHTISDMYAETAPHGWFLVVVLTLCGLGTVLFALLGLRPALRGAGWTAGVGSALLAGSILGLGDLLSPLEREACRLADPGCSTADQLNAGGTLDAVLSTVGILVLVAAAFFLAAAMRRLGGWRPLAGRTRLWAVVLIVLLLATGLLPGAEGLAERLFAAAAAGGVAGLALAVHRRAGGAPA